MTSTQHLNHPSTPPVNPGAEPSIPPSDEAFLHFASALLNEPREVILAHLLAKRRRNLSLAA